MAIARPRLQVSTVVDVATGKVCWLYTVFDILSFCKDGARWADGWGIVHTWLQNLGH